MCDQGQQVGIVNAGCVMPIVHRASAAQDQTCAEIVPRISADGPQRLSKKKLPWIRYHMTLPAAFATPHP